MGKYKDAHGKTRVGAFLQNIAPEILNVAGDLTGVQALNKIGRSINGSDQLSDDQKAQALELLQMDMENERERTRRHEIDMASDSWLSKNVRPMTLIYLICFLTILVLWDAASTSFTVDESYVTLLKTLLVSVFVFYFGGREIQKAILNRKK